jgi:MSHA pilin protein MshC
MMSKLITANRGFTLIEIISVLLVIGILSAVAISRMVFSHQDVDNTARVEKLKTQLRYAQSRAMNTDEIWGIEFSGTSYHLFNGGNVSNTVHLPGEDSVNISLPSGTSITQTVSFDKNRGRPCTDAAGTTPATNDITLNVGGKTIRIVRNTGYIP